VLFVEQLDVDGLVDAGEKLAASDEEFFRVRDVHAVGVDALESALFDDERAHREVGEQDGLDRVEVAVDQFEVQFEEAVHEYHEVNSSADLANRRAVDSDERAIDEADFLLTGDPDACRQVDVRR
jgi:hypothetical protein